ncbi:helix-turn-helix domain-containing protein [Lyngbya confervoides BDU141951]|uniref:Helix-turn-helix domain-containing protein n=2 Tax=Lyngbya TaxID=28073 RepID=A0ABD4T1I3_9CYAN|nr:helix-turn-helix domain-containing protein [Lyngbya confervoides BDU141951]
MSQARLARTLNLDRSTISRWINGSRSIHARYRPLLWQVLGADLRS